MVPSSNMQFIYKYQKHWGIVVFILAVLLYINTIPNFYNMDDELVTINHRNTSRGFSGIKEIFSEYYYEDVMGYKYEYRPIVHLSFAIEHELLGESPHTSHAVNVLLYAITCLLLFLFLKNLLPEKLKLLAWIATVLYVFHPMHTEVVASIKNRDEILALLFALISGIVFLRAIDTKRYFLIVPSVLFFIIGCYSKITIIPLSFVVPISTLLFRPINWKFLLTFSLPFFLIGALLYPFTLLHKVFYLIILVSVFLFFIALKNAEQIIAKIKKFIADFQHINSNRNDSKENWFYSEAVLKVPFNFNDLHFAILQFCLISFSALSFFFYQNALFLCIAILCITLFFAKNIYQLSLNLIFLNIVNALFATKFGLAFFPNVIFFAHAILIFFANNKKQLAVITAVWLVNFLALKFFPVFTTFFEIMPSIFVLLFFLKKYRITYFFLVIVLVFLTYLLNTAVLPTYVSIKFVFTFFSIIPILPLLFFNKSINERIRIILFYSIFMVLLTAIYSTVYHNILYSKSVVESEVIEPPKIEKIIEDGVERPLNFVESPFPENTPFLYKLNTGVYVFYKYLTKTILPHKMGFYYGYAYINPENIPNAELYFTYVFLIVIFLLMIYLVYKNILVAFLSIFIFTASILQFLNIFNPVPGVMGDRFLFIPTIGYSLLFALLIYKIMNSKFKQLVLPILILVLITYGFITINRNFQWKDKITLFESDIEYLDESAQAHALLAIAYMKKISSENVSDSEYLKTAQKARNHFEKAIAIHPGFVNWWYDKGRIETELGMLNEALNSLIKSTEIEPGFLPDPYFNIALIYAHLNNWSLAIEYFEKTILYGYESPDLYYEMVVCYLNLNNFEGALNKLSEALKKYPNHSDLLYLKQQINGADN